MTAVQQTIRSPQRQITDHIYDRDWLTLFIAGTVDYKRVAAIANLDKGDLGKLGKVAKSSVRFDDKIPSTVAERLTEIANIANLVAAFFRGDVQKVELWFKLPNPMLGNISPRDMIRLSRYDRLLNFVLDAREAEAAASKSDAAAIP